MNYDLHSKDWPNTGGDTIHIDVSKFSLINPDYYGTFFHESTHAIDYKLGNLSTNHTYNGKNLTAALEADVRARVESEIDCCLSQTDYNGLSHSDKLKIKETIIDSIMNQVDHDIFGDPDFTLILSGDSIDPAITEKLYKEVKNNINNGMTSMASDAYGAFTGNTIGWGHAALDGPNGPGSSNDYRIYWLDNGGINGADGKGLYIITQDGVRHDIDIADIRDSSLRPGSNFDEEVIMSQGNVTYKNGKEACEVFAEDMSAHLTGNYQDINGLQFFDQDTRDFLNDILRRATNSE